MNNLLQALIWYFEASLVCSIVRYHILHDILCLHNLSLDEDSQEDDERVWDWWLGLVAVPIISRRITSTVILWTRSRLICYFEAAYVCLFYRQSNDIMFTLLPSSGCATGDLLDMMFVLLILYSPLCPDVIVIQRINAHTTHTRRTHVTLCLIPWPDEFLARVARYVPEIRLEYTFSTNLANCVLRSMIGCLLACVPLILFVYSHDFREYSPRSIKSYCILCL